MFEVIDVLKIIGRFVLNLWWIWLPIFLYYFLFKFWLFYIRSKCWQSRKWVLLEIIPPKEVTRSPKSMEQIFAALWATGGTVGGPIDKYLKGEIQDTFSLEIVGISGEIHFFIRVPAHFRNLAEAQIYAQYPDIEIRETEDYTKNIPVDIPNQEWDLWGTRMILAKPDAYPIRVYSQFLDITGKPEEGFIDPLASLMEVLSHLQEREQIWIQIVCRPADDIWKEEGKKIIDQLMGKAVKKKRALIHEEVVGWLEAGKRIVEHFVLGKAIETKEETKEESVDWSKLPYGEQEIIKAIEQNISKKGFESKIQFVYISPKEIMSKANVGAVMGVFNQFSSLHLNAFKPDKETSTSAKYFFAERRKNERKKNILNMCRQRSFWEKGYVLNIEELATVFHFPAVTVEAPMVPRVEAKKGGPPAGLPIK